MGIFDFIKNAGKNLESNEKPKENLDIIQNKKIISNINIEIEMVSYYDEFGKEQKMLKSEWIEEVLKPAILGNWENAEELYIIILDSFSKKIYSEAKDACLRLYSLDKNKIRKTNILGLYYIKTKKYDEAIELYSRYLSTDNSSEVIFANYAKVLEMVNNSEEAEKNYIKALSLNPNFDAAFTNFFNIVKKRNLLEYRAKLDQFANNDGAWRAKLEMAVEYFKSGNKQKGDHYLLNALKESNYNTEVMIMASGIYSVNNLFYEFEKYILPVYNPEKHGAITTLNILKYYKRKGNYKKGLELCKFSSKFSWLEHSKKFQNFEEEFFEIMNKKENKRNTSIETSFSTNMPLWYYGFNKPDFLLNNNIRTKPNLLVLPFTSLKIDENKTPKYKNNTNNLAISIPLFLNDYLHYNTEINYQFVAPISNREAVISDKRYNREYMELIKSHNTLLNYILAGNISEIENKTYNIINVVENKRVEKNEELKKIQYKIEIYLYDCDKNTKTFLIDSIYLEKDMYKIQSDIIENFNEFFNIKNNFKINDNSNTNLFSYAQKFKFLIDNSQNKKYYSWKYKELLSSQINSVLEDSDNDLKKINLVQLLYEISNTNSQLLKNEQPIIYRMIKNNMFNSKKVKILIPIIFNLYNDEENYNKFYNKINEETSFESNNNACINWISKFINYTS